MNTLEIREKNNGCTKATAFAISQGSSESFFDILVRVQMVNAKARQRNSWSRK